MQIIKHFFRSLFKKEKTLVNVSKDKRIGIFFAKNTDLCWLVEKGYVDTAVVGTDSIGEYRKTDKFKIIKNLENLTRWPIVIATPHTSKVKKITDFKTIATQYPKLVKKCFKKMGLTKIKIISVNGSCEAMPYLLQKIDGIVDISDTGKSLTENGLRAWLPPITHVYPVIIANTKALKNKSKKKLFDRIKKN